MKTYTLSNQKCKPFIVSVINVQRPFEYMLWYTNIIIRSRDRLT